MTNRTLKKVLVLIATSAPMHQSTIAAIISACEDVERVGAEVKDAEWVDDVTVEIDVLGFRGRRATIAVSHLGQVRVVLVHSADGEWVEEPQFIGDDAPWFDCEKRERVLRFLQGE